MWFTNLKKTPPKQCAECGKTRSYTNPMAQCYECKGNFCYGHISGGQMNSQMKKTDELRTVCDKCKESGRYTSTQSKN